ncbi:PDR/VanB family oxidoreductase [Halopseudomonas sp. SMJS2]|uniref:PDR/VanB family oxidoreductase n=1 Tax=Halopseudomonas sp. SMJS2 TaxID=3041098 RepID=UPI0024528EDE|nr:PDR/VanB family oxidoreductase [Halopseudomonas sp. SMJS2]WGK62486.1 PDR/VanB family oxidoreductase [Halopseudomonas sp. SMJS2]
MDTSAIEVKIVRKAVAARDIVTLELAAVDGSSLPPFSAGSHIDVEVRPGLLRQYSLCNDSSEQHRYVIGVLRDPVSRGGSIAVHDDLHEGQEIRISRPRNLFPLVANAKNSLLLAGGIGVTPILCMAERLARTKVAFSMHYCARSPDRMAFREQIQAADYADRVHLHFDDGTDEQKLDLPTVLQQQSDDTHLYVCGPGGFIDFVLSTAKAAGWAEDRIHYEFFSAKEIDTSDDAGFEVQIASTGQVCAIGEDDTIVSVLAEAGVEISTSCEQGICGACITRVLEGEVDHRDQVLSDQERDEEGWFTPCCSRGAAGKRLILDL